MRATLIFLLMLGSGPGVFAQQLSLNAATLTRQRIRTTETGMAVVGGWGAANLVAGTTGYLTAETETWRRFHQMNAIWGAVNLSIAGLGYLGCRREAKLNYSVSEAIQRHDATKRLFLLNAGLDFAYIGTGVYLTEHARNTTGNPAIWRGYGRSIMLQGAGLLLFDGIMYGVNQHQSKRWYKLLEGLSFSGNGVSVSYRI